MELHEQLEKIDQLGTDKVMQWLLKAISSIGALEKTSFETLEKNEFKKQGIMNEKLSIFREEMMDDFFEETGDFYTSATDEICAFCGFADNELDVNTFLFMFSHGFISFDGLIDKLKQYAIEKDTEKAEAQDQMQRQIRLIKS